MEQAQQRDLIKRQQAQQQYENQLRAKKAQSEEESAQTERDLHQAEAAHLQAQIVALQHQAHLLDQQEIDRKNTAARAYEKSLVDAGGLQVSISIDGKPTQTPTGKDLAAEFVRDPSIAQGPKGYVRHFVDLIDSTELNPVTDADGKHTHWVDSTTGQPANMADSTTIKVYDVPNNDWRKPRQVLGKEINAARGTKIVDDDTTYNISPEGMSALYDLHLTDTNKKAMADQREAAAAKAGQTKRGTPAQFAAVEARKATALAKAEKQFAKDGDVDSLNRAKRDAQSAYEQEIVALGGSVAGKPGASTNVDRALGLISKLPKDQQVAQIKSSTKLSAAEKQLALQRIGAGE